MVRKYYSTNKKIIKYLLWFFDKIFFRKKKKISYKNTNKNIKFLIVRVEHLGDVLSTLSIHNYIKHYFKESKIDLLINEKSSFLKSALNIFDDVYQVKTSLFHDRQNKWFLKKIFYTLSSYFEGFKIIRKQKYDYVIFPSPNFFGMQSIGFFAKKSITLSSSGLSFLNSISIDINNKSTIDDCSKLIIKNIIGEHKFSNSINLRYSKLRIYDKNFLKKLNKNYLLVNLSSGNKRKNLNIHDINLIITKFKLMNSIKSIYVVGETNLDYSDLNYFEGLIIKNFGLKLSISQLTSLTKNASFVITADSFMGHLSAATNVKSPIYIIYRDHEVMKRWKPPGENIISIYKKN
tara:strand:- start:368 stop:1411 length:1044 start_codon:yes stop_codon:yes gene_type:complete